MASCSELLVTDINFQSIQVIRDDIFEMFFPQPMKEKFTGSL